MSSGGYNATSRNIPAGQWKKIIAMENMAKNM